MKKATYLLIIGLLFTSKSFSQTNISGGGIKGLWKVSGSPYNIQGDITVSTGDSLDIEPGVTVNFHGHFTLFILGKLKALGKINDTIRFTCDNTIIGWGGIRFDNTSASNDSSRLAFCRIENGIANGGGERSKGGGIYINGFSKLIVSNSSIANCSSVHKGGGLYISGCSPKIVNNTITGNKSSFGAGISVFWGSSLITNNNISGNQASSVGGAMYIEGSSNPLIQYNNISHNSAAMAAGLYCIGNAKIYRNSISGNKSNSTGGGIAFNGNVSVNIQNNSIFGNTSNSSGAGIYSGNNNNATVINNFICNNIVERDSSKEAGGGGIFSFMSTCFFSGNVIANNSAPRGGGVMCLQSSSLFTNNTIANNNASLGGGGLYIYSESPVFRNCILWGNTVLGKDNQVHLFDIKSKPNFFYCNIKDSNAFSPPGIKYTGTFSKNININPQFITPTPSSWTGYSGLSADWSLKSQSPCINKGDPVQVYPDLDIAGNARVNTIIDIGAYEFTITNSIKSISDPRFLVYPNPTRGVFIFKGPEGERGSVEIFNFLGEKIYTCSFLKEETQKEVDLSFAADGLYYLRFVNGSKIYNREILVRK